MYSPIVPSVVHLYYSLYRYLANHPLLNHPLVFDPITEEHIPISQYRFMGGLITNPGLTCSIFPGFSSSSEEASPSPATISASVLYKPYNLGHNEEEARYHFVIEYQYRSLVADGLNKTEDEFLTRVPKDHIIHPDQLGFNSNITKEVDLYLNPSQDIVGNYLELTRLALYDLIHHRDFFLGNNFPGTLNNVEVIHQNFSSINWDKQSNAAFCRGYLLIGLTTYLTKDWRKMFIFPITDINLDVNKPNTSVVTFEDFNLNLPKNVITKDY